MKMKAHLNVLACMFMLMFVLTLVAAASPLTLVHNGYPAQINDGSNYVGNVAGVLDGDAIVMWCVDSLHRVLNNTWQVEVLQLDDPALEGVMGLTRDDFKAMFLLGQGFNNTQADVARQHAIWSFADSAHYPLTPAEQALKSWAQSAVNQFSFTLAYTLVGAQNQQSRMVSYPGQLTQTGTTSPIPEPVSVLIFGGGLVALGLWREHRRA